MRITDRYTVRVAYVHVPEPYSTAGYTLSVHRTKEEAVEAALTHYKERGNVAVMVVHRVLYSDQPECVVWVKQFHAPRLSSSQERDALDAMRTRLREMTGDPKSELARTASRGLVAMERNRPRRYQLMMRDVLRGDVDETINGLVEYAKAA